MTQLEISTRSFRGIEEKQLPQFRELGRGGFLEEMICKFEMCELGEEREEGHCNRVISMSMPFS